MRVCTAAGCGVIIEAGKRRCDAHRRGNGLKRKVWERRSRLQRTDQPLCADHLAKGEIVPATQVHHVGKRSEGGDLLSDELLSLCVSCHSVRTARGE